MSSAGSTSVPVHRNTPLSSEKDLHYGNNGGGHVAKEEATPSEHSSTKEQHPRVFPGGNTTNPQHPSSGHYSLPLTLSWRQRYSLDLLFKLQYLQSNASDPSLTLVGPQQQHAVGTSSDMASSSSSSLSSSQSSISESSNSTNPYFLHLSKILTEMLLVIEHSNIEEDLKFEFFEKHVPVGGVVERRKRPSHRSKRRTSSFLLHKHHTQTHLVQNGTTTTHHPIKTKKDLNNYIFSQHKNLKGKFQNSPGGCEYCGTKYLLGKGYHTCRICLVTICRKGCTKNVPFCEFYSKHEQKGAPDSSVFSVPVCTRCEEGIRKHHYPVVRNCLKHLRKLNETIAVSIESYLDLKFNLSEQVDSHVKRSWTMVREWLQDVKARVTSNTWLYLQWNPAKAILFYFSSILLIENQVVCVVFGLAYVLKQEVSEELLKKMKQEASNSGSSNNLIPTYFHRDLLSEKQNFRAVKKQLGLLNDTTKTSSKRVYEPVLASLISKEWMLKELHESAIESLIASTSEMVEKMSHLSASDVLLQTKGITNAMQSYCLKNSPKSDLHLNLVKLEKIDSEDFLFELL